MSVLDRVSTPLGHCHEDDPLYACHTAALQRAACAFQRGKKTGMAYVLLRANTTVTTGFVGLARSGQMALQEEWWEGIEMRNVVASWTSSRSFLSNH